MKPIAVIIKGNPDRIHLKGNLYSSLQNFLENLGYQVEFDEGAPYTSPREDAAIWIGHSRGADRLRFAPPSIITVPIGSNLSGAINHPEDVVDITPEEYDTLPEQVQIAHNSWHPSIGEKLLDKLNNRKSNLRGFTKQAFYAESPSPVNTMRMQPRVEEEIVEEDERKFDNQTKSKIRIKANIREASIADWFPKEIRDQLDSWANELFAAFIGLGEALIAPKSNPEDPRFNDIVNELFATRNEVGYAVIEDPFTIRVIVNNDTFEDYPLDRVTGSITKEPGIEIEMPLQLLRALYKHEVSEAALLREITTVLYHEYAHLKDPKATLEVPWNKVVDPTFDPENVELTEEYLRSPREQDARIAQLIPQLVALIKKNPKATYSELFPKASSIFRLFTRGLPWENEGLYNKRLKKLERTFRTLYDEFHQQKEKSLVKDLKNETTASSVKNFTREATPWTDRELQVLKTVYKEARDKGIPHNQIYTELSNHIPHSMRGIKQKLENLYRHDEELKSYKFEHWDRDRIIREIKKLYEAGAPISRRALPSKLEYQITNHSLPKAITRGFEVYFDSFDHAIAEALTEVGFERTEGQLDLEKPIDSLEDAWHYYRGNEKINNPWTKKEIIRLFEIAHAAGLPLTKSFFTSQPDVYIPLLGINKNLDGLRKSIERLGLTWGDLVIEAVPDYQEWYNEDGKSQVSMGELRVRRFLDLHNVPYQPTTRKDKIPVIEEELIEAGYKNFIPDLFILDERGNPIGLVEVYGAIANSSAASGELAQKYHEKIEAKNRVYNSLPLDYIAIHDNEIFGSDLSDERLKEKFAKYITDNISGIDIPEMGNAEIEVQ